MTIREIAPTITSGVTAYSAGDAIGGKLQLTQTTKAIKSVVILDSLLVRDANNQKAALELIVFDSDPTAATITDNTAFAWVTDFSKVIARIAVGTTDYVTIDSK